jgi:hypothetical protein
MAIPGAKPRGRPFQSGNPGRPPGSKNKVTRALDQLAEGQAEQVFQKITEQALAGDVPSQKIFLDRAYPPPKARPINVPIPPINGPGTRSPLSPRFSARSDKASSHQMKRPPYLYSLAAPFRLLSCKTMKGASPL